MRTSVIGLVTFALIEAAAAKPIAVTPGIKPPPPPAASRVAPDTIKATFFNGEAFTATSPAGVKFKMTFMPDGKATREPVGKGGAKGEGTWKLSKDGFCTQWKGGKQHCYKLFTKSENRWIVSDGSATLATWGK